MLPGAPMVYYGDEIGMWGADDPDNRKPMWRENYEYAPETICATDPEIYCKITNTSDDRSINTGILDLYKKLITIRKNSDALQKGILYTSIGIDKNAEDGILSFGRRYGQEDVLFISNQSTTYKTEVVTIQTVPFTSMFDPLNNINYKANIRGKIQISITPENSIILLEQ